MKRIRWVAAPLLFLCTANPALAQWARVSDLDGRKIYSLLAISPNLFAGTDLGVFLSTDGGATWKPKNAGLPNIVVKSLARSGSNVFVAMGRWVFRSSDSGASWTLASAGLTTEGIYALVSTDTSIFAAGYGGVFRTTDSGNSWVPSNVGITTDFIACLTISSGGLLAGGTGGMFRSTDAALSWSSVPIGLPNVDVTALGAVGTNLYAGTNANGVSASTDNGVKWSFISTGIYQARVLALGAFQQGVVAFTSWGTFRLNNRVRIWEPFWQGLPTYYTELSSFCVSGAQLLAGSPTGLWRRPLSELVTEVERNAGRVPTSFNLDQNYPNPFNPSTAVRYSLGTSAHVVLSVFNTLGQQAATLVDEQKEAGSYSVKWNATNAPSGIYFYRLQAGHYSEIKRMTLLK